MGEFKYDITEVSLGLHTLKYHYRSRRVDVHSSYPLLPVLIMNYPIIVSSSCSVDRTVSTTYTKECVLLCRSYSTFDHVFVFMS